jgi:hypothetical protein
MVIASMKRACETPSSQASHGKFYESKDDGNFPEGYQNVSIYSTCRFNLNQQQQSQQKRSGLLCMP